MFLDFLRTSIWSNTPVFRGSLHPGPKLPSRGHCQLGRSDPRGTSAALQSAGSQWIASTLLWLDATAGPLHSSAGIMNVRRARESNLELSQTLTLSLSRLPPPPPPCAANLPQLSYLHFGANRLASTTRSHRRTWAGRRWGLLLIARLLTTGLTTQLTLGAAGLPSH
ncbi:hypothetical protein CABS02_08377 [Colletotrichum abscissum]|uniref:Uncharacterized protein n=1 Tax=Colletotrichum abscissum TaxID=1671311 RepID=A0A9Q0B4C3_9PEZI|nr:hypothetical protein CABS02_08377 [Colletotrichum abscissum]